MARTSSGTRSTRGCTEWRLPRHSKESAQRSAKARDITLNYYEAGEPTERGGGLPLVMLHGGGPGASAWSNFGSALPRFAARFRTLLVDQPGFGGSDRPPVEGNYYRHAADHVVALLDELCIDRVHLLGNSLGGGTAMRLALSHPDRVGRLVLMGPGGLSLNVFTRTRPRASSGSWTSPADPTREALRAFTPRWWSTRTWSPRSWSRSGPTPPHPAPSRGSRHGYVVPGPHR